MPQSPARSSHRHHRHARRLHRALCRRRRLFNRTGSVAVDGRRRRAGRERAQEALASARRPLALLDSPRRPARRAHGHDLVDPRLPDRPVARLVFHVPRRPAAQSLLQRPSRSFALRHFPPGSPDSSSPFPPVSSTSARSPTSPTSARSSPSSSSPSASSSCAIAIPTAAAASSFPAAPSFPRSASSSASCSWPDCPSSPGTASSSGWSSACSFISSTAVTAPNSHPTNCRPDRAKCSAGLPTGCTVGVHRPRTS